MMAYNDRVLWALMYAVIASLVDLEGKQKGYADQFWRNLELHLIHVHNAVPDGYQPLRDAIARLYPQLQDKASMLREHLDSMSPVEQTEGYERREVLEFYLALKDFMEGEQAG